MIKNKIMPNKYCDTEGEKIISYFLEEENIWYKEQVRIDNLEGDYADYRVADFYIPKYKVYLEFLGMWWNTEAKKKYIKKMDVYEKNGIPCIYIYPNNLWTLRYLFYMRLKKILKATPDLKFQLFKYNLSRYRTALSIIWIATFFLMVFIIIYSKVMQLDIPILLRDQVLMFLILLFAIGSSTVFLKRIFFDK